MRDLSCAWPGCGEELEEIFSAAPQSSPAVAASARALANDDALPPCCLPFAEAAFASSSEERKPPNLVGRLTVPEGESTAAMVNIWENARGVFEGGRRAKGGGKGI